VPPWVALLHGEVSEPADVGRRLGEVTGLKRQTNKSEELRPIPPSNRAVPRTMPFQIIRAPVPPQYSVLPYDTLFLAMVADILAPTNTEVLGGGVGHTVNPKIRCAKIFFAPLSPPCLLSPTHRFFLSPYFVSFRSFPFPSPLVHRFVFSLLCHRLASNVFQRLILPFLTSC
jgi:hypothetical protein